MQEVLDAMFEKKVRLEKKVIYNAQLSLNDIGLWGRCVFSIPEYLQGYFSINPTNPKKYPRV